jgi:hypothetical protein
MITFLLQDSEDLLSGDESDLWDGVLISESNTNLRWSHTLLGVLGDLFDDGLWSQSLPKRSLSLEWQSRCGDTGTFHTTHFFLSFYLLDL